MNGHFAAVGDEPTVTSFEHGIQVIDEDKSFTCVSHRSLLHLTIFSILFLHRYPAASFRLSASFLRLRLPARTMSAPRSCFLR